jgi:hypothetical protein
MFRIGVSALVALGVLSLASVASADVRSSQRTKDGDYHEFDDELVDSDVSFPSGGRIHVRPLKGRVLLIRPRTSFVTEMFKSVEKM